MTKINIMADGKMVGHVEETVNVLMGCPLWEWTCYRGGSGCVPTQNQAVAKVLMAYKHGLSIKSSAAAHAFEFRPAESIAEDEHKRGKATQPKHLARNSAS